MNIYQTPNHTEESELSLTFTLDLANDDKTLKTNTVSKQSNN